MNKRLSAINHLIFCLFMFLSVLVLHCVFTFFTIFHVLPCLLSVLCHCITWTVFELKKAVHFGSPADPSLHLLSCVTGRLSFYTAPQFRYMYVHLNAGVSIHHHTYTHTHISIDFYEHASRVSAPSLSVWSLHPPPPPPPPVMLLSLSISCLHRCCAVSLWFGSVCRGMKGRGSHTDGAEVSMVMYCRWAGKSSQLARKRRRWRVRR